MFLINGVEQSVLAANDRAIQFGDGCFTTSRIIDGQIAFFNAHLGRLQDTCEKLFIPFLNGKRWPQKCKNWQSHIEKAYSKWS